MAEAKDVSELSDKLDNLNVDSESHNTPQTSDTGIIKETSSENMTDLGPSVKLKTSLAQKSRNLSAKDKVKIAEMVKGLAKFKHAEEDIHIDSKTSKGKTSKEKKAKVKEVAKEYETLGQPESACKPGDRENDMAEAKVNREVSVTGKISAGLSEKAKKKKGKKEKKNDLDKEVDNEDEWEDIESGDEGNEISLPSLGEAVAENIVIHVGDKRSATVQPKTEKSPKHKAKNSPKKKAEKEQKSPKVGSYTKLLQTIGGRGPTAETASGFRTKSSYNEDAMTGNQSDPWSANELRSRKRAEAHRMLLEQPMTGDVSESGRSQQDVGGAKGEGAKLSHKEQAKLRSDAHKQKQNQHLAGTERLETTSMVERQDQSAAVKGAMFYRSSNNAVPLEVPDNNALGTQRETSPVSNTKKRKDKKKDQKAKQIPPLRDTGTPSPAMSMEPTSPEISEVKIRVPKPDHRFIVGPLRKNLTEIHNLTGVTIEVPKVNDDSEEILLRGDKFQIGPAITLMYTKCEVSKAEFDQKQKAKEFIQSQMALPPGAIQQVLSQGQQRSTQSQGQQRPSSSQGQQRSTPGQGQQKSGQGQTQGQQRPGSSQGQQRPGSSQGQRKRDVRGQKVTDQGHKKSTPGQAGKDGVKGQHQKAYTRTQRGELPLQALDQGQVQDPLFNKTGSQGQKGQGQRPNSAQGQRQEYQKGKSHGDKGKSRGQGQNKKQDVKNRPRKKVFEPYWSQEDISHGLKRGTLIQGPIRINPKNHEESYIPHPDGKSDILICSFLERNRALNGDIVAVLLKEEGDWKVHKEELQHLETKHGPLPSDTEDLLEGNNSDVQIESEEVIVTENLTENPKISAAEGENGPGKETPDVKSKGDNENESAKGEKSTAKGEKSAAKGEKSAAKGNKSPNKALQRYHNLSDVLSGGSPVAKKLFNVGGSEEEMFEQAKKLLVRTGKVVAIIEKKHSRACTGTVRPLQDKNPNKALFAPNDYRLPRMIIPMEDGLKGLHERPEDFAKTLYVARITNWEDDSKMAFGKLARSLGEAGEIEPETEGMLIENGVDFEEFPQQALDCLPADLPWSIPETEFEYRRDFRESCIFTIDPSTARDLDDALSCEDLGNGKYKVGVHIADVSWFIEEGSVLDRVAGLRATSVYLVHKVIPMLPRLLCEQLCSLNPDEDRLAFSVEWTISESGEVEEEWFGRSVIRSCVKLSYDHAQGFIEQPDRDWTREELPPVSEGFSVQDIKTRVLNLHKIARNLRKARFVGGCLRLDQIKLQYSLDAESGLPNGYWVYQQKESNSLVEEFMLLANMAVAHRINDFYPDKALLRRHPPPQEKMLENLKDQCEALGLHLDTSGAGELQRSLWRYYDHDEYSLARMQVLVSLCSKPMQNAKYFCTGCIDDESLYHHYALNVPLYTHFTSPIRRYPDVIVHRLLGATLDYCDEPSKSSQEIHRMAEHCNDKKTAAKRCSDLSSELFFAVFVKVAGPLEEKAMVMAVFDKAFDIFILRLGVTKRVYCDKLDIKDKIYSKDKKVPSLTLVWNAEEDTYTTEDSPELQQIITIFSVVDCVLKQGELPLQWMAIIKRPGKPELPNLQALQIHDQEDISQDTEDNDDILDDELGQVDEEINQVRQSDEEMSQVRQLNEEMDQIRQLEVEINQDTMSQNDNEVKQSDKEIKQDIEDMGDTLDTEVRRSADEINLATGSRNEDDIGQSDKEMNQGWDIIDEEMAERGRKREQQNEYQQPEQNQNKRF